MNIIFHAYPIQEFQNGGHGGGGGWGSRGNLLLSIQLVYNVTFYEFLTGNPNKLDF